MQCNTCHVEVEIITPHEQFLFGASGLCAGCREKVFEESYRDQSELPCCRNCDDHDWAEEQLIYGVTHKPVRSTGICKGVKVAL